MLYCSAPTVRPGPVPRERQWTMDYCVRLLYVHDCVCGSQNRGGGGTRRRPDRETKNKQSLLNGNRMAATYTDPVTCLVYSPSNPRVAAAFATQWLRAWNNLTWSLPSWTLSQWLKAWHSLTWSLSSGTLSQWLKAWDSFVRTCFPAKGVKILNDDKGQGLAYFLSMLADNECLSSYWIQTNETHHRHTWQL